MSGTREGCVNVFAHYKVTPLKLDSSVVSFKSSPRPKYTQYGTIIPKRSCSIIKLFFFFKYFIYKAILSKYLKKKIAGCRACFLTNCREMWSRIRRLLSGWRIGAVGTGTRHKVALMLCAKRLPNAKPGRRLKYANF